MDCKTRGSGARGRLLLAAATLIASGCGLQSAPKLKDQAQEGEGSFTAPKDNLPPDIKSFLPEVIITPFPHDAGTLCGNGKLDDGEACDPSVQACCNDSCDGVRAADSVCRPEVGACDVAERCDGTTAECPKDGVADPSVECRGAAGDCDLAEHCDGTKTQCPTDTFLGAGTLCRDAAGDCDLPEACTGASKDCPADGVVATGVECRGATGLCDAPESCDGASKDCPADAVVAQGVVCQLPIDLCDAAEVCDGSSKDCPPATTTLAEGGTPCRQATQRCRLDAICTGLDTACPANPVATNGTGCDDGLVNTVNDACTNGNCAGVDHCLGVVCAAADQCHLAGICDHATGACTNPNAQDGTSCNDSNANTVNDACAGGLCVGIDLCVGGSCTASDQCHVAGACNPNTGLCANPNAADNTPCNDNNANTVNDVCTSGICAGTDLCANVTCTALDQCHVVGTCDHATGGCTNPSRQDGASCNDNNANTVNDVCTSGICAGTDLCANVTCTALDQCHVPGSCNHATGACSNPFASNATPCNDGNACTQTDTCDGAGRCAGSNPVTCGALDQCHVAGSCDPSTGACSNPFASNTTPCNDGNACTQTDTCDGAGRCAGSNPVTCTALDQCHVAGSCNPSTGQCSNPPASNTTPCNDGNACTRTDTCNGSGSCAGANPVVCTALDRCHAAGTCNPTSGACSNPVIADGKPCNFTAGTDPGPGTCYSAVCCPGATTYSAANGGCEITGDKIVFVTSVDKDGAVTLSGADGVCNSLAAGANLASTYSAWLSTNVQRSPPTVNAGGRVSSGPYVRIDGALVAQDKPGLESGALNVPLDLTQWGAQRDVYVWTGTAQTGASTGTTCNSFTSNSNTVNGTVGLSSQTSGAWTNNPFAAAPPACDKTLALYCFEDDCPGVPVVDFQNDPNNCGGCNNVCKSYQTCIGGNCGNYVFVSSTAFGGAGGGVAAADKQCTTLAGSAGLSGTFTAWLDATGTPAYKRIVDSAYFLVNGKLVAKSLQDLLSAGNAATPLLSPIDLTESGAGTQYTRVWTGTKANGNPTGADCLNSTSGATWSGFANSGGTYGSPTAVDGTWTEAGAFSCDASFPLYCFQTAP